MSKDKDQPQVIGNNINDLLGASGITDRFLTLVERGVGSLGKPLADRWRNRNQRKDLRLEVQALRDAGLVPAAAELTLDGRAVSRIAFERIREQDNREAIAVEAIDELRQISHDDMPPTGDLPDVEPEWLDHFWDLAGRVTSVDRQALWGRILARSATGRITSARTLTLLSTLSGEEARELERLAQYLCRSNLRPYEGLGLFWSVPDSTNPDVRDPLSQINDQLTSRLRPGALPLFGAIGVLVESAFAYEFSSPIIDGTVHLSIAGKPFLLRGKAQPIPASTYHRGWAHIGNGTEVSPVGAEIFDLITTKPDQEWLSWLSGGYDVLGWELSDGDGKPIVGRKMDTSRQGP